jgi:hypothetical protein
LDRPTFKFSTTVFFPFRQCLGAKYGISKYIAVEASQKDHNSKIAQALELFESDDLIEWRINGMYKLRITSIHVCQGLFAYIV